MAAKQIGIEIGNDTAKLVLAHSGRVQTMAIEPLPEHLVREGKITAPDTMSSFLKEMRKRHRIPGGPTALVLPPRSVIARPLTMPALSHQQLALNLPFEFRDYVGQDSANYYYDYAVMDMRVGATGEPEQLELFAAATEKALINMYYTMLKRAGLTLKAAIPSEMAWLNIVRRAPQAPAELCIVDLGHNATRVQIFSNGRFMMGKEIEMGGMLLDELIAADAHIDSHLAHTYKERNLDGVLELERCHELYNTLAIEVMKAVNFYSYDNRDSNLRDIYYCGSMSHITSLLQAIAHSTGMSLHPISELILGTAPDDAIAERCALAVGAAIQL
jgi:type IV pilus assembly protein PilM